PARPPAGPARVLRRGTGRAHGAQAPGLVCEGPAGERRLPRGGQPRPDRGRATGPDLLVLRRARGRRSLRAARGGLREHLPVCAPLTRATRRILARSRVESAARGNAPVLA